MRNSLRHTTGAAELADIVTIAKNAAASTATAYLMRVLRISMKSFTPCMGIHGATILHIHLSKGVNLLWALLLSHPCCTCTQQTCLFMQQALEVGPLAVQLAD